MSNVPPAETGIKGIGIYISPGQCAGKKSRHSARVKVYRGDKWRGESIVAIVTVGEVPRVVRGELTGRELKRVSLFITRNLDVLLRHWNCELSDRDALVLLKKV